MKDKITITHLLLIFGILFITYMIVVGYCWLLSLYIPPSLRGA